MLAATLYNGDHYLSDMLGGFLVAGGTIILTVAAAAVQGRGAGRAGIVPGAAEASSAAV
jgi:membrane-associated phospholipid phosphatase